MLGCRGGGRGVGVGVRAWNEHTAARESAVFIVRQQSKRPTHVAGVARINRKRTFGARDQIVK